jgi:hypothetical protein
VRKRLERLSLLSAGYELTVALVALLMDEVLDEVGKNQLEKPNWM